MGSIIKGTDSSGAVKDKNCGYSFLGRKETTSEEGGEKVKNESAPRKLVESL